MPSIKEVANRINSVISTQQLTQAMKVVAAAKLNKVQQQVLQMRPYAEKLTAMLDNVTAGSNQQAAQLYQEERPLSHLLVVVMTSDRGLCGSFNANILKKSFSYIQKMANSLAQTQVTILPIGKKALAFFQKKRLNLITDYVGLSHQLDFDHVGALATSLTEAFLQHTYDQVLLFYNEFQTAASQVPVLEQFLPLSKSTDEVSAKEPSVDYIYEPSKAALMEVLVPRSLQIQFYKALLESNASEHGARLTTMSKATDNADELLKDLRLTYNRTRQAVITREISEIVAGADALAH